MLKFLIAFYVLVTLYWIGFASHTGSEAGLYFQVLLFTMPFIGALVGFKNASAWGGFTSAVGRAVLFISLGVLSWSIGMIIWNYYIFIAGIDVPYPSFVDVGYSLSYPLWALGVIAFSKATGVRFALREMRGKVLLITIPILAIAASYYLLVNVARGGSIAIDFSNALKVFFDFYYPIGSAIVLAITLTFVSLSNDFFGGKYKTPILILIAALIVQYVADFSFSYTTTNGTYFNGYFPDFLFMTAMFLFALSLALMSPPGSAARQVGNET